LWIKYSGVAGFDSKETSAAEVCPPLGVDVAVFVRELVAVDVFLAPSSPAFVIASLRMILKNSPRRKMFLAAIF